MGHRLLFLLLSLSLPSFFTSAIDIPIYESALILDECGRVNLQCEWRGEGENCTFVSTLKKKPLRFPFELLDGETDEDLIKRVKKHYPLNTFDIVNKFETGEMCTLRKLVCTMLYGEKSFKVMLTKEGYAEFFKRIILSPRMNPRRRTEPYC